MPERVGPEEAPSGRRQLLSALRSPGRKQVVVAELLALVGFAGVTQVRSNDVDDTFAGLREQDLIDLDARDGSLVHRLRKDRRPLAAGYGPQ